MKKYGKITAILLALVVIISLILKEEEIRAVGEPVKIVETGKTYINLAAAIDDANNLGQATIEISDSFSDPGYIQILADITIVAVDGKHTVTLSYMLDVIGGGKLTLGAGDKSNLLTLSYNYQVVRVLNGELLLNDGVKIKCSGRSYGLQLEGSRAVASINGGSIEANIAIVLESGARITEIKSGEFIGNEFAVHASDKDTRIEKISGGRFIKSGTGVSNGFVLQNEATIGIISGGYFEAASFAPLAILRGAWVEEINGGTFVAKNSPTNQYIGINVVADVYGTYPQATGIGSIANVDVSGYYALQLEGENARINEIESGNFNGEIALVVLQKAVVHKISGGNFNGNTNGIYNAATIKEIGGSALDIVGVTRYGIFNTNAGIIEEIKGGKIRNVDQGYAVCNSGTIRLISGGTFIGYYSALYNSKVMPEDSGKVEAIDGGVFWGKNAVAIDLVSTVLLESEIFTNQGQGRYWGKDGEIFNDTTLVIWPTVYFMSENMEAVVGITETNFKYLTLQQAPVEPQTYNVTVVGSNATNSGTGAYEAGTTVNIAAGERAGYHFVNWTGPSDLVFVEALNPTTSFIMPQSAVTVYAHWQADETMATTMYQVTIHASYAQDSGAGFYEKGELVTIAAGERAGFIFVGWSCPDGIVLTNKKSQTTTFIMPERNVSLTANWRSSVSQPATGDTLSLLLLSLLLIGGSGILVFKKRKRKE